MYEDEVRGILIPSWAEIEAALNNLTPAQRESSMRVPVLPLSIEATNIYARAWHSPMIGLQSRPSVTEPESWEWFVTEMPEFHL